MTNTTVLALEGLSCGHCVASTRKALEAVSGAQDVEVTIDQAIVKGEANSQSLIDAVENAGYHARLLADSPSPK
jgi:Cu+-exporting ATPase